MPRRKKFAQASHLTPTSLVGVDGEGNPKFGEIIPQLITEFDEKLLRVPFARNVDWRDGIVQSCTTAYSKRSAHVQRTGRIAPAGQACTCCANREGPFKECVVLIFEGDLIYNGACANCCFQKKPYNCSFRTALPTWVFDWLKQQNPYHRMIIEAKSKEKGVRLQQNFFPSPAPKTTQATQTTPESPKVLEPKKELEPMELKVKKETEKFGPHYNSTWYQSPLEDQTLFGSDEEGFARARLAYHSHHMLITRAYFDHAWLKRYLETHGRLDAPPSETADSTSTPFSALSLADQ
ncbi:hypothetical protein N7504_011580 [Penicillium tannophilum]|nr:hypothetical protein N7504_011580 [Penicillium tannophilum]